MSTKSRALLLSSSSSSSSESSSASSSSSSDSLLDSTGADRFLVDTDSLVAGLGLNCLGLGNPVADKVDWEVVFEVGGLIWEIVAESDMEKRFMVNEICECNITVSQSDYKSKKEHKISGSKPSAV